MLGRFVQLAVFRDADCLLSINYEDRQLQVQDNQLRTGFAPQDTR